jgi:3'(2'), 5'-bisphosphate nucleotidase
MDQILNYPPALCNQIRRVAIEAGHKTLEYFDERGGLSHKTKGDGSPVTEADQKAEDIIMKALRDITPSVPVVGEEQAAENQSPDISHSEYVWLVDPLDGTRGFVKGDPDYTVNIGLIHKGVPTIGVIYAPALGELYAGCGEGTAIKWNEDNGKEKNISVRPLKSSGLSVVLSNYYGPSTRRDQLLEEFKIEKITKRASSIKFCLIASGKADFTLRFKEIYEWDTAAGDAILKSAGGQIVDLQGQPLAYGKTTEAYIHQGFLAGSQALDLKMFVDLINES